MPPDWPHYLAAVIAGMLAGFINTLAGSGSLITLPMLVFLGLEANVANATNRVGVLMASLVGARTFRKGGHLSISNRNLTWLILPLIAGSIAGAHAAAVLDPATMRHAIGVVMVIMLVVILVKPKRWLVEQPDVEPDHRKASSVAIFFLIGVYGGFIQAGVGIFLLAGLVLHVGHALVRANALKVLAVLVFTVPALVVFLWHNQVHWGFGLLLGSGQCVGAYIAATFATRSKNAAVWIRWLLIIIVIGSILKLFGALDFLLP